MEIAIISGKGGTGKSSLSAAFATQEKRVVVADCDVDAANLYLLFDPTHEEEEVYIAGQKAVIDYSLCISCKLCRDYCRFDAIAITNNKVEIIETSCDGCKLCARICPAQAIHMENNDKSRMYAGSFRNGKMVYGRLAPGEENSGKLVNIVRDKARKIAKANKLDTIIIDGPPGIGCAVISSITGVDHVIIVTEPTMSGLHDLNRTVDITSKFNLKTWVVINKFNLNVSISSQIAAYCEDANITLAGKIPFDPQMVEAIVNCKSVEEWNPTTEAAIEIRNIWSMIKKQS